VPFVDETPSGRDTDRILADALRLANQIWANEDRNVEHEPGYDFASTVDAAVELAGAVVALDGLIRVGQPIPASWARSDQ
jgi:hypothetical protein